MRKRAQKTIHVSDLQVSVNLLLDNDGYTQEEKKGVCSIFESVLFTTNNYRGYVYNDSAFCMGNRSGDLMEEYEYNRRYL